MPMANRVEKMAAAAICPDELVKLLLSKRPGLFPRIDGEVVGGRNPDMILMVFDNCYE